MGSPHGDFVDRPLQLVRLRVEVELATAADIADTDLAQRLAALAIAGLHGMVLDVVRVELNGRRHEEAERLVRYPGDPRRIRPAPDQRLVSSAYELHAITRQVFAALGIEIPQPYEPSPEVEEGAS